MPRPHNRAKGALDRTRGRELADRIVELESRLPGADSWERSDLELQLARLAAQLLDQCSAQARARVTVTLAAHRLAGSGGPVKVELSPEVRADITRITRVIPDWTVWREFQSLRQQEDHVDPVPSPGDAS